MTALYTVAEIREIERANLAALPPGTLMQRAGAAAADCAQRLLGAAAAGGRILAIAGPGNNGGDAIEAARLLAGSGMEVTVLLCADPGRLPADAAGALARARGGTVKFVETDAAAVTQGGAWDLVIDGLFGIGLARPIAGELRAVVEAINSVACPVLALDLPSGLDADTGNVVGVDGIAVHATDTVTFIADKPGLHTLHGRDCAGAVHVADLGIDRSRFKRPVLHLSDTADFSAYLRPRPHQSHKGSYGDVIVLGGAPGMAGAAVLAARAAAKCGAGRVFAAFIGPAPAYDSAQPELMCRDAHAMDFSSGAVVAGPGMGTSRDAHDVLGRALHCPHPLVLDADALNLIAAEAGLQHRLAERSGATLMTPHPLEAARLLQTSTAGIQADRIATARKLAAQFRSVVILKGSGSVIAAPDGAAVINTTGNPALATAGTGDVLAGISGALLAQGLPAWNAAIAAAWLHGAAADALVAEGVGPIGLTAGELVPRVRGLINGLITAGRTRPRS